MPPQEQADLWMSLRDRMKTDWKEMTMQEKKAGAYSPIEMRLRVVQHAWAQLVLSSSYPSLPVVASATLASYQNTTRCLDKDVILTFK
jgi:hypothetical protein